MSSVEGGPPPNMLKIDDREPVTMLAGGRVAKCQGYDGYIRVKIFEGWSKKSGRTHNLAKLSLILGRFAQHMHDFCV